MKKRQKESKSRRKKFSKVVEEIIDKIIEKQPVKKFDATKLIGILGKAP